MHKRKGFLLFLALGIVSLICVGLTFYFVDPEENFYGISPVIIFFLFTFLSCLGVAAYISMNMVRGILISFFITALLILQMTGFANLFYIIILLLIVVTLDLGLKKR